MYASTQNKQDKVRMAFCGSKMILVVILESFPIAMIKKLTVLFISTHHARSILSNAQFCIHRLIIVGEISSSMYQRLLLHLQTLFFEYETYIEFDFFLFAVF